MLHASLMPLFVELSIVVFVDCSQKAGGGDLESKKCRWSFCHTSSPRQQGFHLKLKIEFDHWTDVQHTTVEQFMGSLGDWSLLWRWLCWPGYLLQGASLILFQSFGKLCTLSFMLLLRSKMFKQGMGLASCNNALGYWHYPGDVFMMDNLEKHQHWKYGDNSFDCFFTRNAWLQLVDGQVLILNFIFNSANSTNLIFVISHFALRYENLSLESE